MKKLLLTTTCLLLSSPAWAQTWEIDCSRPPRASEETPWYYKCVKRGSSADELREKIRRELEGAPTVEQGRRNTEEVGRQHTEKEREELERAKRNDPRSYQSTITPGPSGGHTPPSTPGGKIDPPTRQKPPPREYWGAAAASLTEIHVAAGTTTSHRTADEAKSRALAICRSRGGTNCKVLGTFSGSGCGYVSTGKNERTRQVGYGAGRSAAEALSACRERGLVCNTPIGGCANDD